MSAEVTSTKTSLSRRLVVNYIAVYGLPTLVLLSGFYFGKNVLFSVHSAIGWMVLYLSLLIALGAQLIRIAASRMKVLAIGEAAISMVAFAVIAGALYFIMPNYWP